MFFRFFDNENSGYLLGHIVSWKTKFICDELSYLILDFEKEQKWLEYSTNENLISDVNSLAESLNEYYAKAMSQEEANQMGYVQDACGYEDYAPNEMDEEEYEEEDKITGFRMEKK